MGNTHNRTPEVGTETQLLIDDHVVDEIWLIRRAPEMPVKHLNNPVLDDVGGNTDQLRTPELLEQRDKPSS